VTRRVLIECGAAETRAALLEGDDVLRFWFGPARGDESTPRPARSGDVYVGRIRTVSRPLKAAFVDLGIGPEGFLPLGREMEVSPEGGAVIVRVRRPAIGAKGPVLTLAWKKGFGPGEMAALEKEAARAGGPARLGATVDAAVLAARALAGAVSRADPTAEKVGFSINQADAARPLRETFPNSPVEIAEDLFERHGAAEALEGSLGRVVSLAGGARMVFDETEGLTVVDIDAGAAADGATGKLNDKVNLAAARQLFLELARRGVGGRVVADFLPPSDARARAELKDALKEARRGIYECRIGRLSDDGLFDLTAPRERLSLLELATEPAGHDWPAPGRRLTLDWQAKAAIRALERRLAGALSARPVLAVGLALADYLAARPQWTARLAARFGARFAIMTGEEGRDRCFDVVQR
jgi:Ribonuclease G/E